MQTTFLPDHRVILDRFVDVCQTDPRIAAAFLVGSYVKGKVHGHSDPDLYLITTEEAYDDFVSKRESFVRQLGEPLFMEDFDLRGIVFLIFGMAQNELSHFIKAMGRGQHWWAQGELGALRLHCMNLARLRNDFADPEVGEEGYFKAKSLTRRLSNE